MEENTASLMAEALQRLGSQEDLNTWLLTPVSPGGKSPMNYLSERQYTLFHGFLLQTRTGRERFHPLPPSNRVHQKRPREEFEDALERLRPRAWIDEGDNVDTSDVE